MSRFLKAMKEDVINKIIEETFAGREATLTGMAQKIFVDISNSMHPEKETSELLTLPESLHKKYIPRVSSLSFFLGEGISKFKGSPKKYKTKSRVEKINNARINGEYFYAASKTARYYGSNASFSVTHKKGGVICSTKILIDRNITIDDYTSDNFWQSVEYLNYKHQIVKDRHRLIVKLGNALSGINTIAQLAKYDKDLLKYLPKTEKAVKSLVVSPKEIKSLISCCKSGEKPCS